MTRKNRRNARRTKQLILIMLLLCMAAACCIVLIHSHRGDTSYTEEPETTETADENGESQEDAEAAAQAEAEKAAAEARSSAASHVYSYFGPPGGNEFSADAYDSAIAAGSKNIRAAMVVSADGIAYVAEDDHAFDMTGVDGYFSGMAESQISNLTTKSGQKVLKLSDLFDKYGDSVTYIIDVKYISSRNTEAFEKAVRSSGLEGSIIAASSYLDTLSLIDNAFPEMSKLYMCSDQATFDVALERPYIETICVTKEMISAENLKAAHENGKKLGASLLNSEEDIRNAVEMGVDSYFTDDTELAISLEQQYRGEAN